MKVVIIDDEQKSCDSVRVSLERHCPEATVAGIATDPLKGMELIALNNPDIIFLDIQMPDKNGFELLEEFRIKNFEVIFITAYDNYAIEAIKVMAVDYVLKPFTEKEIVEAYRKAEMRVKEKISAKFASLHPGDQNKKTILTLPISDGLEFVEISDIIRCEAEDSYTWFYLSNKSKLLVSGNLHTYEKQLEPHGFHRIHNSHMVNIAYIKKYVKGRGGYVVMSDGKSIDVSVRKKAEFFARLMG